jgi:hypothetical protein
MHPPRQASNWPHFGEPARVADIAGQELVVDGEWAGIDVAHRIDQADHATRSAQVQAGQRLAVTGQVEERVAGEDILSVGHQPSVEDLLLVGRGMELVPHVGTPTGRTEPGEPELGTESIGQLLQGVQLVDIVPGDHH